MPSRLSFLFLMAVFSTTPLLAALPENVVTDLRAKAEAGDSIAQYNLGIAYADPAEPFSNASEAYAWLTLAAERGSSQSALTALLAKLSPDQLAEGKRRLESKRTQLAKAAEQSPFLSPITPVRSPPPAVIPAATSAEISALREEKKQLAAELSAAWREAEAAKVASIAKVAELNQQLGERDQTIAALKAQVSPAPQAAVAATSADIAAKETTLKQAELAREKLSRDLTALSNENASLKSQLAAEQRAHAQVAARELESRQHSVELTTARDQVASLRADLDKAQATSERALAEASALKLEKERTDQRIRELTVNTDRDQGVLKTELETARRELASRDASLTRLTSETARLNEELTAARAAAVSASELSQLRDQLNATRSALAAAERERDELKQAPPPASTVDPAEIERLQKQLADADSKLSTTLRSYTLQQQEIEAAHKRLAEVSDERAELTSKLEAVTQEKATLSEEISASAPILAEIATLRDQLRHAQAQNALMAVELNQLKTRVAIATPTATGLYSSPTRPGTAAVPSVTPPTTASRPQVTAVPPPAATPTPTISTDVTAPASPPAAATSAGPRVHIVQLGDSLFKISQQYYGRASRWDEIAAANRDVLPNPNQLVVGTPLRIP